MILGIGTDLIDIRRIEKTLERFGERFIDAHLHRHRAARNRSARPTRAASYAKRFAAKEACAKALGTGLRRGVFWRDMGVVNLPLRQADHGADRRRGRAARRDHAAGLQRPDRPHHHRRLPAGPGHRDHLGGARSAISRDIVCTRTVCGLDLRQHAGAGCSPSSLAFAIRR